MSLPAAVRRWPASTLSWISSSSLAISSDDADKPSS
jgi:hypothetical protein